MSGQRLGHLVGADLRLGYVLSISVVLPVVMPLLIVAAFSVTVRADDEALRAFTLRNSDSDRVAKVLKSVLGDQNLLLVSDARTNTIVVRANQPHLNQVEQLIAQLDRKDFLIRALAIQRFNRRVRQPRQVPNVPNLVTQVLADGTVEIRAPTDAEYWVRGLVVREGTSVKKNQPLMLLDNSDIEQHEMLLREIERLREHLAKSDALSRQHRNRRTDAARQRFAEAAKRSAAIRAGISEKTRQLHQLKQIESTYIVPAEIDGVVTFAHKSPSNSRDGVPVEPRQLLLRIRPE